MDRKGPGTVIPDRPAATVPEGAAEPAAAPERQSWWSRLRRPVDPGAVTLGELAVFAAGTVIAVVALISLAAAHLGVHRLSTILPASAALLAVLGVLAWFGARPPRVVLDPAGLLPLGAAGVLSAWMFLPGFHYIAGDRDPGGYVDHAFAIARYHSYTFTDQLLATHGLPVQLVSPGARFPAVWVHDMSTGQIIPQFYHLWPALMATSYDARGYGALANTGPIVGVIAVMLAVAVARRIAGPLAAWATGALLATQMMEVWQAKYPSAEILAQLLYVGALLGIVISIATRWRWPALVAGMLVVLGYLDRADGLLFIVAAVGGLATLWVLRRFDARAGYFAAGFGVLLPYGLYQAYGPAKQYTHANSGLPTLKVLVGAIAVCVLGALLLRPPLAPLARWVDRRLADRSTQRWVGGVLMLGALGLFGLGLIRPIFGADYTTYGHRPIRTYDERNLYRLSWFFSWPGLLLMLLGLGYVLLRRWTASAWLVGALTAGLFALYVFHLRNSPYFMWVGRRLVPSVIPGMVLLIAFGLVWIWAVRLRGRLRIGVPVALLLAAFVGAVQVHESLPLRSHDEWGGSYGVVKQLAALSGNEQGVYLWQPTAYCCAAPVTLFSSPIWMVTGEQSVLLPSRPAAVPAYVQAYVRHFTTQPVFLVYDREGKPPAIPGMSVTRVWEYSDALPHWQESSVTRPWHALRIPIAFTVYRVAPTP